MVSTLSDKGGNPVKHNILSSICICAILACLAACGGGSGSDATPSSTPTGLSATGSLRNIRLSWTAPAGVSVAGYNIYRSTDGAAFTKLNSSPVAGTVYDDTIASPAGDGLLYYYKVTSVSSSESGFSSTVATVHGTRLSGNYPAGFTTLVASSPYVIEGSVTVDGGDLNVATGTKLYILNSGSIDVVQGRNLTVSGLLRVLASTGSPALFTSHGTGGAGLTGNQGFSMRIENAVDYAADGNSGTFLQNSRITNLQAGSSSIYITGCSPRLYNLHISTTPGATSYAGLEIHSGAMIEHCEIVGLCPMIIGKQTATGFQLVYNTVTPGVYNYVLDFEQSGDMPVNYGQISFNSFDSLNQLDLSAMTGGWTIPLGNNHWKNGLPTTRLQNGSDQTVSYNLPLIAPPSGVGPTW